MDEAVNPSSCTSAATLRHSLANNFKALSLSNNTHQDQESNQYQQIGSILNEQHQPAYQRLKLCKRGFRETRSQLICGLSFEGLPAWAWAIRLAEWKVIYITDADERRLRQCHVSTWTVMESTVIVVDPATSIRGLKGVDVWFSSGSLEFIAELEVPLGAIQVAWLATGARRKPKEGDGWKWVTACHARVGGTTTSSGMFGLRGCERVVVPVDPIQRTIGHLIKYSERPTPCAIPFDEEHYTVSDRLSVQRLDKPVVFSSGFSRTGWGKRLLVASEIGQAFDLPAFIEWSAMFVQDLVPLHLFRVVLDAVLENSSSAPAELPYRNVRTRNNKGPDEVGKLQRDAVWLPQIERWLPGSWAVAPIADKAVKDDNAVINCAPWHNRIRLLFPCPVASLALMEELTLRVWRRSVCRSFFDYLTGRYGPDWAMWLHEPDQRLKRKAMFGEQSVKRRRVLETGGRQNMEGGNTNTETLRRDVAKERDGALEGEGNELRRDVVKGREILSQVLKSSWWEWTFGSSLFFWRWNGRQQQQAARDGMRSYILGLLPVGRRPKKIKLKPEVRRLVAAKIEGMTKRSYLETGHVTSALDFFAVPKGDSDVRVVFDGTSCGLNKSLWAPNFFLPSATSAVMLLTFSTWMSDMDFGEMFHNFPMEERLRKCAGVEFEGAGKAYKLLRWSRLFMGMRPSPFCAVRYYYWGEEFAKGDPSSASNPMGYDCIRLNLPGMEDYDPQWPKVMKWVSEPGAVAGDVVTFVDDVRMTGYSKENCHGVHRQFASRMQWLGMQDAPRKFRPPSQDQAGAWTGTIFKISATEISKSVSQEKWEKGQLMVKRLKKLCDDTPDHRPILNRKTLEQETGFLNHLSMTFEGLVPYLKGFYLSLNSWRSHRDEGDWKVSDKRWKQMLFAKQAELVNNEYGDWIDCMNDKLEGDAPLTVKSSLSFASDVEALALVFGIINVPVVRVRCRKVLTVIYGFGDASGTGLGATFTCGSGFNFRIGV